VIVGYVVVWYPAGVSGLQRLDFGRISPASTDMLRVQQTRLLRDLVGGKLREAIRANTTNCVSYCGGLLHLRPDWWFFL
jgi:hypothetical protein